MARDTRNQPPTPIGRASIAPKPAPAAEKPTQETDAQRLAREATAHHKERPDGAAAAYGSTVRMAFVFLAPHVYARVEQAAWMDEESPGNWMARVLDDAAYARTQYVPPPAEPEGGGNPPADPDE